jgi:2'-hydroxyisoflavone reductase
MRGMLHVDITKATTAGLSFRPLAETIADTLSWVETRPDDHAWQAGLPPEREAVLLTRRHQRTW